MSAPYVTNSSNKAIAWDGIVDEFENLPPAESYLGKIFVVTGANSGHAGIFISTQAGWKPLFWMDFLSNENIMTALQLDKFREVGRKETVVNVPDALGNPSDVMVKVPVEITFANPRGLTLKLTFDVPDTGVEIVNGVLMIKGN